MTAQPAIRGSIHNLVQLQAVDLLALNNTILMVLYVRPATVLVKPALETLLMLVHPV